jgi:hypothetical protein
MKIIYKLIVKVIDNQETAAFMIAPYSLILMGRYLVYVL